MLANEGVYNVNYITHKNFIQILFLPSSRSIEGSLPDRETLFKEKLIYLFTKIFATFLKDYKRTTFILN